MPNPSGIGQECPRANLPVARRALPHHKKNFSAFLEIGWSKNYESDDE
jgi:hypothetical protein